jgi:3-oxoacyl-[acyl-carrier-protein] synthase I
MESAIKDVWVVADTIISPLGSTSEENFQNVSNSVTGIRKVFNGDLSANPIYAGKIDGISEGDDVTRFEEMCLRCVRQLVSKNPIDSSKTLFVLSTTKGNIDLLKRQPGHARIPLHTTAQHIAALCGFKNAIVISNACVSGVMAITVAKRYLQSGAFEHAVVLGADELTSFVVSGFQSLGALSDDLCRPFDAQRKGINLGEAAAAVLLSVSPEKFSSGSPIKILGSGLSNDANHISGPSRTGEELAIAITTAISESKIDASEIDFISAHGTATIYNDEMEAKAFSLTNLSKTPLHSLKACYGHTLGAAGVLETVIGIQSLKNNLIVPSVGFNELGVSKRLNVSKKAEPKTLRTFLKTASGFGGCNAALIIQKLS